MSTMVDTWVKVCKTSDIPENGGACALLGDKQIAIFNYTITNEWFATDNLCPHKQQMAISRGMVGSHGEECEPKVACPFHKKTFSLKSGECLSGDDYKINTYEIKVEGDDVYLRV